MKIEVYGYNSFKAVIDEISSPPDYVFYTQTGGQVLSALAKLPTGDVVFSRTISNSVTNFTTEYTSAVEVSFVLEGEV